ncbi:hypothetical protein DVH24_004782 [Malus domestica]|uniref:Uncharacterized protein n=1 Tax=Malus domestica TaxID=3750 RepID=A0A498IAT8_MALDO|nr:hypothetical protein DVH24_004782 [Malus domestica]
MVLRKRLDFGFNDFQIKHFHCHIPDWLRCSTILSVLGLPFPHGFVSGNSRATSEWVTHPRIALTRTPLTSKFRWNPKPVSSQKALYYREESMYI